MQKIAITGNMGTGKSLVGRQLTALGFPVLDTDEVVAKLFKLPEVKDLLQDKFSYAAFNPDGQVNKKWLAQIIFSDQDYRIWLQKIIWRRVRSQVELWLFGRGRQGAKVAFVLVPLLFEANMQDQFDDIWLVYSEPDLIWQRLQARDKITLAQAKKRLATQTPDQKKRALVKIIISNCGTINQLERQVVSVIKRQGLESNKYA